MSLSSAGVERVQGWHQDLGPLSEAVQFEVDAPVISDLSEDIVIRQLGTASP